MFDIPVFKKITYIVKMAGTTDVHRDIRGIRAIGVRDTEVILYMSLFILLFSKYYTDIKIPEEIITI